MKETKAAAVAAAIFMTMLFMSILMVFSYMKYQKNTAYEKTQYLLEAQVSELDRVLSSYIHTTDTLRILIVDSQGKINDFNMVAQELYNDDKAFRSIQLAPDGRVQYVYPLKGNEDAFGDLFADPDRRIEAEYARDTGNTTLAGPFELYQSGMGIVIRQPIYLQENGQEQFWGFAIVVLNVPEIFDSVHLESLDNLGYSYQLWRINPDTEEKQIIIGEKDALAEDAVSKSFPVPGGVWTLSLIPKEGWNNPGALLPIMAGTICVTLLVPILCYVLLLINEQNKKMSEMSYKDYLTDLYNCRKLSVVLEQLRSSHKSFYFIYLDIDKFKQVNDTMGHATGDVLLKAIAGRILNMTKHGDYAFRIGGDEFALVLQQDIPIDLFMQRLVKELSKGVMLQGSEPYFPQVSTGYARYPQDSLDPEEIMSLADKKMYEKKYNKE